MGYKEQLSDVILVGGSMRIPKLRRRIMGLFDGQEIQILYSDNETDLAIAHGAAMQAAKEGGIKGLVR